MPTTTVTKGYNNPTGWISGETVTPEKLNFSQTPSVSVTIDDGDITESKLATGAVTGAAGGGKLAASAITSQTAIDTLANDDALLVYDDSNTALRKATWNQVVSAASPAGSVINTLQDAEGAYTSVTAVVARSDTAPTNASGTEVLSQAIKPTSTSNKVLVRLSAWAGTSAAIYPVAIICRGSTVIQTVGAYSSNNERVVFSAEILDSPNTDTDTTYTVRFGVDSGTLYLNGSTSTREYGGTSKATLTLQEIKG